MQVSEKSLIKYIMFSASAKSLSIIQALSTIGSIAGAFYVNWSLTNILLLMFGYFLFSGIGVSLTMHRYFAHRSFEFRFLFVEKLFTVIAMLSGRGSPIGWVYVHRLHHAFADTAKDPHDPKTVGWKIFFPHLVNYGNTIDKKIIKDLFNKKHLLINRYYMLFLLLWTILLGSISLEFLYFFYVVPIMLTFIALDLFVFLTHDYGYRNYQTNDNSKNNWFISLILWGEGWHNNHHKNASSFTTTNKWWEIDILGGIIYFIKK